MSVKTKLVQCVSGADRWLKKAMGEGNEILYHFVRLLSIAVAFALLVGATVWVVSLVFHAVAIVVSTFIKAAPYLLAIAILAGIAALAIYLYRQRRKRRRAAESQSEAKSRPEAPTPAESPLPSAAKVPTAGGPADEAKQIRHELLAADEATRSSLQAVLASLQRFDHRLELVITPAHYTDLFGDNWAHVRQFVESPQGKRAVAVSVMLVEIMILYQRAQEVRWVPINDERIRAWWHEAARRRKWLADVMDGAAHAESLYDVEALPSSDSGGAPAAEAGELAAPKLNSPPSLDDLLRYYQWVNRHD